MTGVGWTSTFSPQKIHPGKGSWSWAKWQTSVLLLFLLSISGKKSEFFQFMVIVKPDRASATFYRAGTVTLRLKQKQGCILLGATQCEGLHVCSHCHTWIYTTSLYHTGMISRCQSRGTCGIASCSLAHFCRLEVLFLGNTSVFCLVLMCYCRLQSIRVENYTQPSNVQIYVEINMTEISLKLTWLQKWTFSKTGLLYA